MVRTAEARNPMSEHMWVESSVVVSPARQFYLYYDI
jgi:hypothetical protein